MTDNFLLGLMAFLYTAFLLSAGFVVAWWKMKPKRPFEIYPELILGSLLTTGIILLDFTIGFKFILIGVVYYGCSKERSDKNRTIRVLRKKLQNNKTKLASLRSK